METLTAPIPEAHAGWQASKAAEPDLVVLDLRQEPGIATEIAPVIAVPQANPLVEGGIYQAMQDIPRHEYFVPGNGKPVVMAGEAILLSFDTANVEDNNDQDALVIEFTAHKNPNTSTPQAERISGQDYATFAAKLQNPDYFVQTGNFISLEHLEDEIDRKELRHKLPHAIRIDRRNIDDYDNDPSIELGEFLVTSDKLATVLTNHAGKRVDKKERIVVGDSARMLRTEIPHGSGEGTISGVLFETVKTVGRPTRIGSEPRVIQRFIPNFDLKNAVEAGMLEPLGFQAEASWHNAG